METHATDKYNKNNDVYVRISGVEWDYTNLNINIAQAAIAIPFEV